MKESQYFTDTQIAKRRKSKAELSYTLKVQSYKLYDNIYVIASIQITNTEIFAFIAVLVFRLLSHKVLFINRKNKRNC